MMRIGFLLNPQERNHDGTRNAKTPHPSAQTPSVVPDTSEPKRQKLAKDAMILTKGSRPVGAVNFPPYEAEGDSELAAQHLQFRIHPVGDIASYHRHIPYASGKKEFKKKTGREAFEVFQYTYMLPGDDRAWVVVWDYNNGLVRITPFFKSLNYTKTTPAKVLNLNTGLRGICHSITGGALTAQGYWMPYKAARAVATTFCHDIRFALTPIFGNDFPPLCLPPKHPKFADFAIDPAIVQACIDECALWTSARAAIQENMSPTLPPTPSVSGTPFASPCWGTKGLKQRRKKDLEIESGYGTDTDKSDTYIVSPEVSPRSTGWKLTNRSQSPNGGFRSSAPAVELPSPTQIPSSSAFKHGKLLAPLEDDFLDSTSNRTKRTLSRVAYSDNTAGNELLPSKQVMESSESENERSSPTHMSVEKLTALEADAIRGLVGLRADNRPVVADSLLYPVKRTRRGSKY